MNEFDNHNQVVKLCSDFGNKRLYNDYHRLYKPCKICVAKNSARHYQPNRDKINARSNLYQENTNYVRKSLTQQKEELNNIVEEFTRGIEMLFLKFE